MRVTRGKMVKLNFGATVHKVLRLEVDARAFAGGGDALAPEWDGRLPSLARQLAERPSVLRIAYRMAGADEQALADRRLKALGERMRAAYEAQARERGEDGAPRLVIETESFVVQQAKRGAQ